MTYNKKEAERLFGILAKRMNKEIGYNSGNWELDYAPSYGGYVIVDHLPPNTFSLGGIQRLFGGRLPCREFCKAVEFALDVLDYQDEQMRTSNPPHPPYWLDKYIAEQRVNTDILNGIASPHTPADLAESVTESDEYL
jgi:hypothetical protein